METPEEKVAREAKEAEATKGKDAEALQLAADTKETERLADEEKKDIASYGDEGIPDPEEQEVKLPEEKPVAAKEKKEDDTKEPLDVPGPGEPGYVEPQAKKDVKEDEETPLVKKLREQIDNIDKANIKERARVKDLKDENELLKNPVKPKDELVVDSDVEATVKAVIAKERDEAAIKLSKDRTAFGEQSAAEAREIIEAQDGVNVGEYNRITDGYFGSLIDETSSHFDEKVLERFRAAENPGQFAYDEGKKLYDAAQELVIADAELVGRKKALEELDKMGLPTNLSTVPGAAPRHKPLEKKDYEAY